MTKYLKLIMKTKNVSLFLLLTLATVGSLNAQYRVKSVTCFSRHMENIIECSHTLSYDDQGKITAVEVKEISPKSGEVMRVKSMPVEYEKNAIKIPKDSKYGMSFYYDELKIDNQNRITNIGRSLSIKYNKDGSFNELTRDVIKYKAQYDEQGRLSALLHKDTGRSNHIYYNENGLVKEISLRSDYYKQTAIPFWTGACLDSVLVYNRDNKIEMKIVFTYNENNNLVDQKIFKLLPDYSRTDDSLILFTHYIITYEEGKGNDDSIYLKYNDWLVSILLDRKSFDYALNFQSYN